MEANEAAHKRHTLCWDCAKATTGDCNWSQHEDFAPVDGWKAIPTRINVKQKKTYVNSFYVIDCPEFERDSKSGGLVRLNR